MADCTHDCSSCGENCSERTAPQIAAMNKYSNVKKVIGVVSGKGGVGKSSVTSMLASAAQRLGYKAAILDADITGPSIPKAFGLTEQPGATMEQMIIPIASKTGIKVMSTNLLLENETDPVLWRGPVLGGAIQQFWSDVIWGDIDVMFVDMPPGTGDVAMTVYQNLPIDGVVIVTSPQQLVKMIVEKAVKMADMMNIPVLGIVENMSYFICPNCNAKHMIYGESHVDEIAKEYGIDVVAKLPFDTEVSSNCDKGSIEDVENPEMTEMAKKLIEK